jgi:hypothetical protein
MIVDAEHKIRPYAGKCVGQLFKVIDFKIVVVIWRFIVRRVKKKQGAGLVIGLSRIVARKTMFPLKPCAVGAGCIWYPECDAN